MSVASSISAPYYDEAYGGYVYKYEYSYTYDNGVADNRSISLPRDCYDRYTSCVPRCTMSQQNFMKVVQVIMMGSCSTSQKIHEAFYILDADGSGTLDVNELSKVIPAIIPGTTYETLRALIRRYDKNFDNRLNLNEFTRLIMSGLGRDLVYRDIIRIDY